MRQNLKGQKAASIPSYVGIIPIAAGCEGSTTAETLQMVVRLENLQQRENWQQAERMGNFQQEEQQEEQQQKHRPSCTHP